MKYDVIIIGSGLGGLECAYLLSKAGRSVLVVEQAATPGGCLQSYRRHGLSYDTGLHYVGGLDEGQSLHAIFRYLGLLELPWKRLDADGFDRVTIGGQTFLYAEGFEEFGRRMSDYFPAERTAIRDYVELLKKTSGQELQGLNPSFHQMESLTEMIHRSAWGYLNEQFRDPLLRDVLSGTSLKMELRKESLPLFTFLHGNCSFIESSWRLQGSSSLLVDKLCEGIRQQGGTIRCKCRAEELVEKAGKIRLLQCADGETYEADWFISDLHPALTNRLIRQSERMRPIYRHRITALENTFGIFTVSLTLKPGQLRYRNWNQYVYTRPDVWSADNQGVSQLLISCRVPEDGSDYMRQMDLLTPTPCHHWPASQYDLRKQGDSDYTRQKEEMAEACLRLANEQLPLLECTESYHASTPLTWQRYTGIPEGSAYGVRKDYRNPLATLLSPCTPLPNLLLTGQSLILHGVHGVTMTALYTSAQLMGREAIWKIINQ
ncbi:MAG: phytoene desaturase family protein [Parabacteroides sp.]